LERWSVGALERWSVGALEFSASREIASEIKAVRFGFCSSKQIFLRSARPDC
jgi:hypothetical protein